MSENIYIDRKRANYIAWGHKDNDYEIIYDEQADSDRWYSYRDIVIKRKSDGKLFGREYSVGLTEMQHKEPFEEDDANLDGNILFEEFKEIEVVKKEYVPVDES